MTEPVRSPRAAVNAYLEALNRGQADEIAQCVSEGFINEHTSTLGETIVGRQAYRQRVSQFLRSFSGLHYETEEMLVDGELVAVAYTLSAVWHSTENVDPRGRPFTIRGMFRFRVKDGLIVHRVDYWDSSEFMRQVDAQPKR